jgi:hypothetical protein
LFFYEGQRLNLASADPSARGESEAITLHGYFDAFNFFFPNNSSDDFTQESQGPTYFKNIANSIVKYVFSVNCDQRFVRVRGLHGMRLEDHINHTCGFSLQVRAQMMSVSCARSDNLRSNLILYHLAPAQTKSRQCKRSGLRAPSISDFAVAKRFRAPKSLIP